MWCGLAGRDSRKNPGVKKTLGGGRDPSGERMVIECGGFSQTGCVDKVKVDGTSFLLDGEGRRYKGISGGLISMTLFKCRRCTIAAAIKDSDWLVTWRTESSRLSRKK